MTRGTTVLIEIVFNLQNVFGSQTLIDPTNPVITVTGPDNINRATDVVLTRYDAGRYYYTLATFTTWRKGYYTSTVTAAYNSMPIKLTQIKSFILE